MGRKPSPENQARQDQALAYLRDCYPIPATTGEIAKAVWVTTPRWRGKACRGGCVHCPTVWVESPYGPRPDSVACRAALLRLERDGAVERVPVEGFRHTFWRATDTDMLASMLDEMGMAE